MAGSRGARQAAAFRAAEPKIDRAATAKAAPWAGVYAREPFAWDSIAGDSLADGIGAVLRAGNAITLGLTTDGGAVRITVWQGGQKHVAYAAVPEVFDDLMAVLAGASETEEEGKGR